MTAMLSIDLLIVDDDQEFRETLASRFSRSGFAVQAAANGEEALDLATRRNFDVAIFDMMMPGMSGLELLQAVQGGTPRVRGDPAHRPGHRSRRPSRR